MTQSARLTGLKFNQSLSHVYALETEKCFIMFCLDERGVCVCACVPETGRVGLPLTSSLPVSSSLLPISCCRPLMPMTAASSGRSGNGEGFSDMAARRKLAASVALGKQVEVRRAHGLLSTWRKRRELRAGERQNTTRVTFFFLVHVFNGYACIILYPPSN